MMQQVRKDQVMIITSSELEARSNPNVPVCLIGKVIDFRAMLFEAPYGPNGFDEYNYDGAAVFFENLSDAQIVFNKMLEIFPTIEDDNKQCDNESFVCIYENSKSSEFPYVIVSGDNSGSDICYTLLVDFAEDHPVIEMPHFTSDRFL